jgi:hypothetical protein
LEVEGTTTNWTPIASFSGTFDGNGHTITGLTYNDPLTHNIGFFSQTKGATIRKLGLINAYFIGNENIGGFVGTAENTTVQECFVEGSYIEARDRAGAIAGRIMYGTTIENSYAAASELKAREQQVGGLVGASMESDTPIRLSNTYFDGTVIGGTNRACGILGLVDRAVDITIENSVNLATEITGGADGRRYRIAHWGNDDIKAGTLLDNNYSLAATIVGEDPIATDDENCSADKWHGANIPEGDGNAKAQAFYETTLGWDFDSAWLMLDDGNAYPVLSAFYSGDATLSALSVDEGDLSPAFDAATTEYTLEVENAIESVTVHATPNHESATAVTAGGTNLVVGENTVTVTVTAENLTTQVYTITVTRNQFVGIAGVNVPDVTVTATQGRILAQFEGDAPVRLYSVTGQLIDETVAVNSYRQSVKQGVYILSIQNKAYKVLVK